MKKTYALENNLGQLELDRKFAGSKYRVSLDGKLLGEVSGKEARQGKDFSLSDGSTLNVKTVQKFITPETLVFATGSR